MATVTGLTAVRIMQLLNSKGSSGLHVDRPLASAVAVDFRYLETDTLREFRSDGASWTLYSQLLGMELGYAERTTTFTAPSSAAVDVTSLSITITEGSRPYMVEAFAGEVQNSVSANLSYVIISDAANNQLTSNTLRANAASTGGPAFMKFRVGSPTPGASKTYKVRMAATGGIPNIQAFTSSRAYIQAVEV